MVNDGAYEKSKRNEESSTRGEKSGGEKSMIGMEDINQMGYLKFVVKENLRLHPPLPILLLDKHPRVPNLEATIFRPKPEWLSTNGQFKGTRVYWTD